MSAIEPQKAPNVLKITSSVQASPNLKKYCIDSIKMLKKHPEKVVNMILIQRFKLSLKTQEKNSPKGTKRTTFIINERYISE